MGNAPCQKKVKSQNPLRVSLRNGNTMDSTHTASLDIPELSKSASIAHIFPSMENHSLLPVGQLCNEGYYVTFRIDAVTYYSAAGKSILKGRIYLNTCLWCINLRHEKPQLAVSVAHNVYELRNTGSLVNYLHKAMFKPTKSALLQAIKNCHIITWPGLNEKSISALLQAIKNGHLITWQGLNEQVINKHLKKTPATDMGHMHQRHQNIRSTSKISITSDIEDETVTPAGLGSKTHLVYAMVIEQGQL
jgi:hypothetical protein